MNRDDVYFPTHKDRRMEHQGLRDVWLLLLLLLVLLVLLLLLLLFLLVFLLFKLIIDGSSEHRGCALRRASLLQVGTQPSHQSLRAEAHDHQPRTE